LAGSSFAERSVRVALALACGGAWIVALGVSSGACSGAAGGEPRAPAGQAGEAGASSRSSGNGGEPARSTPADAGPDGARPFAGSPMEASQLIGIALDKKSGEMQKCVREYRTRKNLPHERVEISVGIDQEGRLLGAVLKRAKPDPTFSECVQGALSGAPFPRSHAGVITMTKSYEEIAQ